MFLKQGGKTWWEETGIQHDCLLHILCPLCQPDQKNCCVETIMVFRRHRTGLLGQLSTVRQQESITGKNCFLQWILYVRPSSTWNLSQTTEQLFTISQRNYYTLFLKLVQYKQGLDCSVSVNLDKCYNKPKYQHLCGSLNICIIIFHNFIVLIQLPFSRYSFIYLFMFPV